MNVKLFNRRKRTFINLPKANERNFTDCQKISKKLFVTLIIYFFLTMAFLLIVKPNNYSEGDSENLMVTSEFFEELTPVILPGYLHGKWRKLSYKQKRNLSRLGRILYLDEQPPKTSSVRKGKHYTILIWKSDGDNYKGLYPKELGQRHHYNFDHCSVNNCHITHSESDLRTADIVIFNLHALERVADIPVVKRRSRKQIWTFFSIESPMNSSALPLDKLGNLFNWSMTYAMSSDIPVPYGRTRLLEQNEKADVVKFKEWNSYKRQDTLVAIVNSKCRGDNKLRRYVNKLQKFISVAVYGRCGSLQCESDNSNLEADRPVSNDCTEISQYKFYLAFEDPNCDEYITEQLWWYAYSKNAIPIVMGGSRRCYEQMLPPQSYLHVEAFAHPRDLANYIIYLNRTLSDIKYFRWKQSFKVINEHGYFGTDLTRYCRICEALNYNSRKPKVHRDLVQFFKLNKCYPRKRYFH